MWKYLGYIALLVLGVNCATLPPVPPALPQGPTGPPVVCKADFDIEFRKCFKDNGNVEVDSVFSLLTQGASGPLPVDSDPKNVKESICSHRLDIVKCINVVPRQFTDRCPPGEQGMMLSSVQSIAHGMAGLCEAEGTEIPPCFHDYDVAFRSCLAKASVDTDHFFKLLSNTADGTGMSFKELQKSTCQSDNQKAIVECTSQAMTALSSECTEMERMQVGGQVQRVMVTFRDICSVCLSDFEHSFEQCFSPYGNLKVQEVYVLIGAMSGSPIPPEIDADNVKDKLCRHRSHIVSCLHRLNREQTIECSPRDNMFITNTVSTNIQGTAAICQVEPEMPPCLKTFDDQFRKCLTKIQVKPDSFFTVISGQADNKTVEEICEKAHNGKVLKCSKDGLEVVEGADSPCSQREVTEVEYSVKRSLAAYEGICMTSAAPGGLGQLIRSKCIQDFTASFQNCLNTRAQVGLEMIMGLMSKGPATVLLPVGNREQMLPKVCMSQDNINSCIKEMNNHDMQKCSATDKMVTKTTVTMAEKIVSKSCKDFKLEEIPMPACLQKFDRNFRKCMKAKKINPDHFFKVLSNQTVDGMTTKELKNRMCDTRVNPEIVQCAMSSLKSADECSPNEQDMVHGSVKQALSQFEGICLSTTLPGGLSQLIHSKCLMQFSKQFRSCLLDNSGVGLDGILTTMASMEGLGSFLPLHHETNTEEVVNGLCKKRDAIDTCIVHINDHLQNKCGPGERSMVRGTVDMVEKLMAQACTRLQQNNLSNDKEELRTNCDRERKEFENRLSSLQQQHKMLKTQNDDLQAEYSKLNLDLQKDKEEQKQVESQRNQEYMQLKQEKELELTSLKDQLANLGREKQQLAEEVNNLRTQLQNAQRQSVYDQSVILQQKQQLQAQQQYQAQLQAQQAQILQQQQGVQQGQGIVQQAQGNIQQQAQGNVQQQAQGNIQQQPQGNIAQQQPNVPVVQGGAVNDQQANAQIPAQPAQGVQEMQQAAQVNQQPADNQVNAAEQAKLIEENQQQHQVQPPNIQDKEPEKQDEEENGNHGDVNHDNRIQNQGPVGLQVQEPPGQIPKQPGEEEEDKVQRSDDKNVLKVEHHPQDSQGKEDGNNNLIEEEDKGALHNLNARDDKDDYNDADEQQYDDDNDNDKEPLER